MTPNNPQEVKIVTEAENCISSSIILASVSKESTKSGLSIQEDFL